MGEVITFRASGASRRAPAAAEEAQILLFTGIRYLRIDSVEPPQESGDPAPRATPRRRRARRRA